MCSVSIYYRAYKMTVGASVQEEKNDYFVIQNDCFFVFKIRAIMVMLCVKRLSRWDTKENVGHTSRC